MKSIGLLSKSFLLAGLILMFFSLSQVMACEIEFEVEKSSKKEVYDVGDKLVIKVKVTFTHRVCTIGIKQTEFEGKGLKILTATDWKETSHGVWERKLKVKVEETKKGEHSLSATRTCDKMGGFGSITLKTVTPE